MKTCPQCNRQFAPGSNRQKWCPLCKPIVRRQQWRRYDATRKYARILAGLGESS